MSITPEEFYLLYADRLANPVRVDVPKVTLQPIPEGVIFPDHINYKSEVIVDRFTMALVFNAISSVIRFADPIFRIKDPDAVTSDLDLGTIGNRRYIILAGKDQKAGLFITIQKVDQQTGEFVFRTDIVGHLFWEDVQLPDKPLDARNVAVMGSAEGAGSQGNSNNAADHIIRQLQAQYQTLGQEIQAIKILHAQQVSEATRTISEKDNLIKAQENIIQGLEDEKDANEAEIELLRGENLILTQRMAFWKGFRYWAWTACLIGVGGLCTFILIQLS